ncbi:MAG TPA: hypothetical protein VF706_03030 [Solirubrobacteraceae bacterium]
MNRRLLAALTPLFVYNYNRDAYVLRLVGRRFGPVLKRDRRVHREPPVEGVDMRRRAGVRQRLAA